MTKPGFGDAELPDQAELDAALSALIDAYLTRGCPCRFPRFRTTVRRSTRGAGGGSFTTWEQARLIALYAERLPLVDRVDAPQGWTARCGRCAAEAIQASCEFSPGGWIDYLTIVPAPAVPDLGAQVEGKVLRASSWIAPGPAMGGMASASRAYPYVGLARWLEWMSEPAP